MKIGGISILLLTGILNYILILFQLGSGLRILKVPLGVHRKTGALLVVCASAHALLAILAH